MNVEEAFKLAIQEAQKGAPYVSPNPAVGCVILNAEGEFISSGYHQKYGEAHAEINALQGVSAEKLRGGHLIVTLEPCAHQGKTPSCAQALAKLPLKKVTYGLKDPNPLVAGQGHDILVKAGIETVEYLSSEQADLLMVQQLEKVCEIFLKNFRQQKIFMAAKLAQSLDGKTALENGESQWITGPIAREHAHYLRACYDMTVVGAGTIIKDNPHLNIRHPKIKKQNKILIIDPKGHLVTDPKGMLTTDPKGMPATDPQGMQLSSSSPTNDWNVFSSNDAGNVFVVLDQSLRSQAEKFLPNRNIIFVPVLDQGIDWDDLLNQLWGNGVRSLFIEGGARTVSYLLQKARIDRLHLYQSTKILGKSSQSWSQGLTVPTIEKAPRMEVDESSFFGQDFYFSGLLQWTKG